jgi:hypothetical protein
MVLSLSLTGVISDAAETISRGSRGLLALLLASRPRGRRWQSQTFRRSSIPERRLHRHIRGVDCDPKVLHRKGAKQRDE